MRILLVGLDLNPPWVEGIRNTVRSISKEFIQKDDQVFVLTKGSSDQPPIEYIEGIKFYRIRLGEKKSSNDYLRGILKFLLKLPFELYHIIKSEKIDIVHAHSVYSIFGVYCSFFARVFRTRSVFSLYSSHMTRNQNSEYPLVMKILDISKSKFFIILLSFLTQRIIVTSARSRDGLYDIGINKKRVMCIPVGVNTTLFVPRKEQSKKNFSDVVGTKKIILFAGDITPWKGLDIFLKSVKIISKKYPNVLCLVLTKEIYRYEEERRKEILKFIEEAEIGQFIKIIGKQDDICSTYNEADLIVFPFISLFSVMDIPLSIVEAMSCEKPVIATNVGSISELIDNNSNGLLIDPNNIEQLNDAMLSLLLDEKFCLALAKKARNTIISCYDIKTISKHIRDVYSDTLLEE